MGGSPTGHEDCIQNALLMDKATYEAYVRERCTIGFNALVEQGVISDFEITSIVVVQHEEDEEYVAWQIVDTLINGLQLPNPIGVNHELPYNSVVEVSILVPPPSDAFSIKFMGPNEANLGGSNVRSPIS
jgi:hypothetical protein